MIPELQGRAGLREHVAGPKVRVVVTRPGAECGSVGKRNMSR